MIEVYLHKSRDFYQLLTQGHADSKLCAIVSATSQNLQNYCERSQIEHAATIDKPNAVFHIIVYCGQDDVTLYRIFHYLEFMYEALADANPTELTFNLSTGVVA